MLNSNTRCVIIIHSCHLAFTKLNDANDDEVDDDDDDDDGSGGGGGGGREGDLFILGYKNYQILDLIMAIHYAKKRCIHICLVTYTYSHSYLSYVKSISSYDRIICV